jgi:fructose-bisphosphate aldolase, class I
MTSTGRVLLLVIAAVTILQPVQAKTSTGQHEQMMRHVAQADGFIAALDQSGGSTPKALHLYGYPSEKFVVGEDSMYDSVHEMRTRIILSPAFTSDRVFGTILFEDTMKRTIKDQPVAEFLWKQKGIVPFLKIDQGLMEEENGVKLMKPIPNLEALLQECQEYGVFGTKMRSVILSDNAEGIKEVVEQQFDIGRKISSAGLVPILEPEVAIDSPSKERCEEILKAELLNQLNRLQDDEIVILKVSLPSKPDFYKECIDHPRCLRVVALSGGYSREEATLLLGQQPKMVASFSRALTEGLDYYMSDEDFDRVLDRSVREICVSSNRIK